MNYLIIDKLGKRRQEIFRAEFILLSENAQITSWLQTAEKLALAENLNVID
jgi:hypothetical protein